MVRLQHTLPTIVAVPTSRPLEDNRDHICVISAIMVLGKFSDT